MSKNKHIALEDTVVQEKGNIVSDMDKEKVMLSIHNGKYYNLGEVGGLIWGLIEQPTTVTALVSNLMVEYQVEQSVCEGQVITFLEQLLAEGLIQAGVNL